MSPFNLRLLRWLLFFYCLFILYGAFIPFEFTSDPQLWRSQGLAFFAVPFSGGVRSFSTLDVVANIFLFIPFGFLFVGGQIWSGLFRGPVMAVAATGLLGLFFSTLIEAGQMLSPSRTASIIDVACNGMGAAIGGAASYYFLRGLRGDFGVALLWALRQQPALVVLCLLLTIAIADAFYPFHIAFDVSTIWNSLKQTRWIPFRGGLNRFWGDLLVEKVLLFSAIGYLTRQTLLRAQRNPTARAAWAFCTLFSIGVEAGKLFFVGRVPNADNIVLSSFGALAGVIVVPQLVQARLITRHPVEATIGLLLGLIAYAQLSPFDWIASSQELSRKIAQIEWLPFRAYYGANPQSALFDLAKKLMLLGPLGFCLAASKMNGPPRQQKIVAVIFSLTVGVMLEALQILLRSRTPSVTDLVLFALGSWAGAVVFERYSRIKTS